MFLGQAHPATELVTNRRGSRGRGSRGMNRGRGPPPGPLHPSRALYKTVPVGLIKNFVNDETSCHPDLDRDHLLTNGEKRLLLNRIELCEGWIQDNTIRARNVMTLYLTRATDEILERLANGDEMHQAFAVINHGSRMDRREFKAVN